jgi:hypothetical protein
VRRAAPDSRGCVAALERHGPFGLLWRLENRWGLGEDASTELCYGEARSDEEGGSNV